MESSRRSERVIRRGREVRRMRSVGLARRERRSHCSLSALWADPPHGSRLSSDGNLNSRRDF